MFSVERYRCVLGLLRDSAAEWERASRALAAFDAADGCPTERERDEALEGLAAAFRRDVAALEARQAAERQAAEASFSSAADAAAEEAERSAGDIRQRFAERMADVEHRYEEDRWMLSALLDDDSERNPKQKYERRRAQLNQSQEHLAARWEELKAVHARATELVEERRQGRGPEPERPDPPRNRQEAAATFDAAAAAAELGFRRLQRQNVPRLFAGWTIVSLGVSLWGGLMAASFFLVDFSALGIRTTEPTTSVWLSAAASCAGCLTLLTGLWIVASAQTARAFGPIRQAVVVAEVSHQSWLRFAKTELCGCERDYRRHYEAIVEHRDRSYQRFAADREKQIAELTAERDAALLVPLRRAEASRREAAGRLNRELFDSELTRRRDEAAIRSLFEQNRDEICRVHERRVAERAATRNLMVGEMLGRWTEAIVQARGVAEEAGRASRSQFPSWQTFVEGGSKPSVILPAGLRLGDYRVDAGVPADAAPSEPRLKRETETVRLPAVLPFPASSSLFLAAPTDGRTAATALLQVASLRLLTSLPPGKIRFTFIDPVGLGEGFSAFMHLVDFDDLLVTGRVWTEAGEIERRLGDLSAHMEDVFQKYLRHEFDSLEEYNAHAGEVAEPYRVLVVANYPAGFTDRAAERLEGIIASGPRCGVYTLLSHDPAEGTPRGSDAAGRHGDATVLRWDGGTFVNAHLGPDPVMLEPDTPPPPAVFRSVVRRIGEWSKDVRRVEVPFRRIAPAADDGWTGDSRRGLDCPLGRSGATKLQHLRLGTGTSQHVLVAGKTGSGKSTLLHVLITNLAMRYSPDEVEFFLVDFKKGVEFKAYAAAGLPHARVIAIESDREFGVSVLERLDAMLKTRGDLFREIGVQDVASFREARPTVPLPRVLLVVDEFQEFFTEDDRLAQSASLLLDRLVRQGRAFGIHVLLGSQTLGGAYSLARTTLGQMAVRVALQCGESDAHLILSEDNTAARRLNRPGDAIYNDANGLAEGNSPFQIAWLGDDERDECLRRVKLLALRRNFPPVSPVVFEGNVPADPARNAALVRRIEEAAAGRVEKRPATVPSAWIGEAVAITGPTDVSFRRRPGSNLIVVGHDVSAAGGILAACATSLACLGAASTETSVVVVSPNDSDDGPVSWRRVTDVLDRLPVTVSCDAAATVTEVAAEVVRRQAGRLSFNSLFLIVDGLSRFRELRRAEDDFGFGGFDREKPAGPGKGLLEVLRDGPSVGVHTIVWCDSCAAVDRWLGRSALREFSARVALPMSANDSSNLIDSPAAGRLGANRALLYSDDQGTTEKFRPYRPPTERWLTWLTERFSPADPAEDDGELDINEWVVV